MKESVAANHEGQHTRVTPSPAPTLARSPRSAAPSPAQALQLQRAVGNRVASRMLARWSKHPDEKEKGKLVTDEVAADYLHFNVPLSK